MTVDVACIIPWRSSGDPDREANLDRVVAHLTEWANGRPVVLASDGRSPGEPFCRSAAYNAGMRLAPADVWVFNEADMLVPFDQLDAAVSMAAEAPGLVVPFTTYRYMSQSDSRIIRAVNGEPTYFQPEWVMDGGRSIGAVNVLSAKSMALTGRWDETLESHGYDDDAMFHAFDTACGSARWVDGPAWHLWHPSAFAPWEAQQRTAASRPENFTPEEVAATYRNRDRVAMYAKAQTAEQVRELTMGLR